jgi:hypothetical protein
MMFDRFDICEAWFVYAMEYHEGKHSAIYAVFAQLSRIGFQPSPLLGSYDDLEENGQDIYDDLVARHARSERLRWGS